ncbi:MAG: DegT/DnrJ/EryC1/StrS family aminotransferase [Acidimicrobiia bacterium]
MISKSRAQIVPEPPISLSTVDIGSEEEELVLRVLRSGHLAQGEMVAQLEAGFRSLCGVQHAIAVSSGTVALVGALAALGIGPGDEVITSPFTFVATLNAILEVGATARFADIDADDFTIDPVSVESCITARTRVVMPVHLYGQPAAMDRLTPLAHERAFAIVEDAAQAHGAAVGNKRAGSFGVGCFSLYATKNVTTGEGGIVTTDDDDVADRIGLLRNQGMRARYEYVLPGHNWRLTDLQAAIGVPQLGRLASICEARRRNAERLSDGLAGIEGIVVPTVAPGRSHVFHQYTVRVTSDAACDRDALAAQLARLGIATGVYYPRVVHDYECYRDHPLVVADPTPVASRAATEVLSLPVHQGLDDGDLDRIVDGVRNTVAGRGPR